MRGWLQRARDKVSKKNPFHLHLISDSTGDTLATIGRAAAAQYVNWRAVEHVTPMVRDDDQLDKVLANIDRAPGIVLYTLVNGDHAAKLQETCKRLGVPAVNVLAPLTQVFDDHLGETMSGKVGAQHALDEDYFGRLDAIKFAMTHDDGNLPDDIEQIDIILIGISRTSKTPTSIYLAQRGIKVANIPLVPGMELPPEVLDARQPLIVGLLASAERILQVRENRWPMIDVSKRSVEETSAAILALRRAKS